MKPPVAPSPRLLALASGLAIVLAVCDRLWLLLRFGVRHTGTDDVIFWNVAMDMAKGIFREPFLYGQNYNPPLESLLAVPLLWAQVPPWWAMPLVTSFLALAPFLAFAWWHRRRGRHLASLVYAAFPVLLPVEWGMITTLSRGFVTGIALLAMLPLLYGMQRVQLREWCMGALLMAAQVLNPNVLLIAAPIAIHAVWSAPRPLATMGRMALGALPVALLQLLAVRFYALQPGRIVHRLDDWRMTFHPGELIPEAMQQLDLHLAHTMPLWWKNGHVILWVLGLLALFHALRGRRVKALAIASVFPIVLLGFAFPKLHDGFASVFFPYSRMFLALPLLVVWSMEDLDLWTRAKTSTIAVLLLLLPGIAVWKAVHTDRIVQREMAEQDDLPVREFTIGSLRNDVAQIARVTRGDRYDLLVLLDDEHCKYRSQLLAYGGPVLDATLPPTLYVGPDRRLWRRTEGIHSVTPGLLVLGGTPEQWSALPEDVEHQPVKGVQDLYAVTGNRLTLHELLVLFGREGKLSP